MVVKTVNLNFRNTPLEHRYNMSIHISNPERCSLTQGERATLIPSKSPNPQGYQGIWTSPDFEVLAVGKVFHGHFGPHFGGRLGVEGCSPQLFF